MGGYSRSIFWYPYYRNDNSDILGMKSYSYSSTAIINHRGDSNGKDDCYVQFKPVLLNGRSVLLNIKTQSPTALQKAKHSKYKVLIP
jgi:hypothetical protein